MVDSPVTHLLTSNNIIIIWAIWSVVCNRGVDATWRGFSPGYTLGQEYGFNWPRIQSFTRLIR